MQYLPLVNCWNIEDAIKNATVSFSKADLSEGTVATVNCIQGELVGNSTLNCIGGLWDSPFPVCSIAIEGKNCAKTLHRLWRQQANYIFSPPL